MCILSTCAERGTKSVAETGHSKAGRDGGVNRSLAEGDCDQAETC